MTRDSDNFAAALTKCYYCLEGDTIVMNTRLSPTAARRVEGIHGKVVDTQPCSKCAGYMKQGIILISIRDDEPEPDAGEIPDPYRTGGWCVVTEEACMRVFGGSIKDEHKGLIAAMREHRFMFVEDALWDALKLPREDIPPHALREEAGT